MKSKPVSGPRGSRVKKSTPSTIKKAEQRLKWKQALSKVEVKTQTAFEQPKASLQLERRIGRYVSTVDKALPEARATLAPLEVRAQPLSPAARASLSSLQARWQRSERSLVQFGVEAHASGLAVARQAVHQRLREVRWLLAWMEHLCKKA